MRIWTFSDWHLERGLDSDTAPVANGIPDADVCVVPGDLHLGEEAVSLLGRHVSARMPVVYVPGNHDYRHRSMCATRRMMAEAARQFPDMHLLDPGVAIIDGVRFVGATLWTDYAIAGAETIEAAMDLAAARFGTTTIETGGTTRPWTPREARLRHLEERAFIERECSSGFDGMTVVVTHHAPHMDSVHPRYRPGAGFDPLFSGAYVSHLEDLVLSSGAALWVHGHVHDAMDYTVGKTRVQANPHGYRVDIESDGVTETVHYAVDTVVRPAVPPLAGRYSGPENRHFDPLRVIELQAA